MALTCPVDLDVVTLRNEIRTMYARVAAEPDGQFHFHRGPEYAIAKLGYDQDELAQLPLQVPGHAVSRTWTFGTAMRRIFPWKTRLSTSSSQTACSISCPTKPGPSAKSRAC